MLYLILLVIFLLSPILFKPWKNTGLVVTLFFIHCMICCCTVFIDCCGGCGSSCIIIVDCCAGGCCIFLLLIGLIATNFIQVDNIYFGKQFCFFTAHICELHKIVYFFTLVVSNFFSLLNHVLASRDNWVDC